MSWLDVFPLLFVIAYTCLAIAVLIGLAVLERWPWE